MLEEKFIDRDEAGRLLAERLEEYSARHDAIVLGLPRGGIPIGFEIAKHLSLPLSVLVVRKIGMPGNREAALGALALPDIEFIDQEMVEQLQIKKSELDPMIAQERQELRRRAQVFTEGLKLPSLDGITVILTDDGLATGATLRAAIMSLRSLHPANIIVAVPVAAAKALDFIKTEVNQVICLIVPKNFRAVGDWYKEFDEVMDDDVLYLLQQATKFEEVE